jgi:hypothetical protein
MKSSLNEDDVEFFCRPDRSQMIPFKPRRFPAPGSHPVAGGEYPMPEGIYNLVYNIIYIIFISKLLIMC